MRVDPSVTRLKYDRELALLEGQERELNQRGIFLLRPSTFPFIDVVFVPRHRLRVAIPVTQQGALFLPPGTRVAFDIPNLSTTAFTAHFDLSNYDLDAPALEFRDPWTNSPLQYNAMFRAFQFDEYRKAHLVLLDDHPVTHKPFLCLRGIREYHEHPQHSGDQWLLYRGSINMFSIVMSLWRVAIDIAHPALMIHENGAQVQWVGEDKL